MYILKIQNVGYYKVEIIENSNNENIYYLYYSKYALRNIDRFLSDNLIFNKPKYILSSTHTIDNDMNKNDFYLYCINENINFQFEIFKNFTANDLINKLSHQLTKQINFIFALNNNDLDNYRRNKKFLGLFNIQENDIDVKLNLLNNLNINFNPS